VAYEFYITVKGRTQGAFKGAAQEGGAGVKARGAARGTIPGIRYLAESLSPRDEATGQASGKRIHKPITVTKEWDASSPQLFQALVENEVLDSVLFEFVRPAPNGKETVYYTVKLTDASVSNIRSYLDLTDTSGDRYDAHALEDVSFVFRKIEIENKEAKTMAVDDWQP
jgi:type VI secretion system secreted protein Hcp